MSLSTSFARPEIESSEASLQSKGNSGNSRSSLYDEIEADLMPSSRSTSDRLNSQNGEQEAFLNFDRLFGRNDDRQEKLENGDKVEEKKPLDLEEFKDNVAKAYERAVELNKPLVIIMGEDWCSHCSRMKTELADPRLSDLAKDAVFVYTHPSKDAGAKALAQGLDIKAIPAISVLEPSSQRIEERARLNGFFNAEELETNLKRILEEKPKQNPSQPEGIIHVA